MAKESGWWTLNTTVEPDQNDLDHIATLIKDGYTNGEIVQDESEEE